MRITVCDLCDKDVRDEDIRYLAIQDIDQKPKMKELEICTICAEKVKKKIQEVSIVN